MYVYILSLSLSLSLSLTHTHTHTHTHRKEVAERTGEAETATTNPRKAQVKAMFSRLAGDDGEVDAEELQDILTASLSKDMGSSVFSLDACRAMISMLDVCLHGEGGGEGRGGREGGEGESACRAIYDLHAGRTYASTVQLVYIVVMWIG